MEQRNMRELLEKYKYYVIGAAVVLVVIIALVAGGRKTETEMCIRDRWRANVKSVKVKVNGGAKKMYVCTSCLKSGKVERA